MATAVFSDVRHGLLQAAHETRHRAYLVPLLLLMRACLGEADLLLYCDHYAEQSSGKSPDLSVGREEQMSALRSAGFGGMALYRALA